MKVLLSFLAILPGFCALSVASPPMGSRETDLRQYVHHVWQRSQGLPQNSVNAVVQTRDGYLWLGTQEGLVRFDGVKFTLFSKANSPEFSHNDVNALAEGPDGSLWIGTYGGLLQLKDGRFVAFPTHKSREQDVIECLAVDRYGTVWVGTQAAGVNRLEGGRFQFFSAADGLASNIINDVTVGADGAVWVATTAGLTVYRGGHWATCDRPGGARGEAVWRVFEGRDRTIWAGTNHGLAQLRDGVLHSPAQPAGLASSPIRSLRQDRDGVIWAGTDAGVVWRVADAAASFLSLAPDSSGNTVFAITEDREGSIWVGTYTSGLHRLWRGRFSSVTRQDGIADDDVRAILQARDGRVWISTEAAGLSRIDRSSIETFSTKDGLAHNVVRALFEDAAGTLWAGTRAGLSRFDGRRFQTVAATAGLSVRALGEDEEGVLWLGTATRGVCRLVNGTLVDVASDGHTKLPAGVVRLITRDHEGAMWVGTNDSLTRWRAGSVTTFTAKDGMPTDAIYCLHEDASHTYWWGSYGGGLVRMKGGRVTRYTRADGLFDDVVYQILEDGQNNLWMSCNNGVYRVDKAQLEAFAEGKISHITCVSYDDGDGMLSSECNGNTQPAGWKTTDGRLWFPTTRGVLIIEPGELRRNPLPPLVVIEGMTAGRHVYRSGETPVLAPGSGEVEFDYSGLSFIAPQKILFRYRLEGLESEWVDAGERRQTVYTNLAPGRYVFRVIARNKDGVWSEGDAHLAFDLTPYFYQTAWFRIACVLVGAGVLLAASRLRGWRHLQRERELTRRVDQALSRIKVLSGLIPICAHCKKIRDDQGYWNQLEQFLKTHSQAEFSHGICPDCMAKLYPDYTESHHSTPAKPA